MPDGGGWHRTRTVRLGGKQVAGWRGGGSEAEKVDGCRPSWWSFIMGGEWGGRGGSSH